MEGPGLKPVDNETHSQTSRISKEGKTITYKLHVIQQPQRARACGSGAKSSADRRPVDPPAIVELKIYEGDNEAELQDVTFSMNSSYLLFATLDHARHIARGRVQQEQQRPVVLTGTPVAGMVYLDRPTPAGYFIFPDLSVRHEGTYRLGFNLYEQSKDAKDEDQNVKATGWANGYVTHRLEVHSQPFTVFSAKKFPGLAESTSLSRIVAEQGCRVRIRRDVRMRRRDNKSTKEWDDYEDETSEMRVRHSATPEASGFTPHGYMEPIPRPRSGSNASHVSIGPPVSRRPSLQDINQGYGQATYGAAPQTPQNAYAQSSPFITGPSPSQPHGQPPYVQQQSSMQPPPPSYHQQSHQQSHQQAPSLPPAPTSHQGYYGYAPAPPPVYETSYHSHRQSVDYSPQLSSDRRSSAFYTPNGPALPPPSYSSAQSSHTYHSQPAPHSAYHQGQGYHSTYANQHVHQSTESYIRPPPAEPVQPPTRTSGAHTPLSARPFSDKLPPLVTTLVSSAKTIEPASPASSVAQVSSYNPAQRGAMESHKRNFGQVFNERHLSQPLRHGSRPNTLGHGYPNVLEACIAEDGDSAQEPDHDLENQMVYRRADGRHVNRSLPPHD